MKLINNVGDLVAVLANYPAHLPIRYSMTSGGVKSDLALKTDIQINQVESQIDAAFLELSFVHEKPESMLDFKFARIESGVYLKDCYTYAKEFIALADAASELFAKNAALQGTSDSVMQALYEYISRQAREHFYISTHLKSFEYQGAKLSARLLFAIYAIDKIKADIYKKAGSSKFEPLVALSYLDESFFELGPEGVGEPEVKAAKDAISTLVLKVESFTLLPFVKKEVLCHLSINLAKMAYHSKDEEPSMKNVSDFLGATLASEEMQSAAEYARNQIEF